MIDIGADARILTSPGDNAFRWRHGERLEDLFQDHCDALRRAGRGGDLAVDGPGGRLTYDELDAAANRVARFLVGYICNFVRVAAETHGYTAADRVYQGLTMAFDFAIEETWVPWLSGATLVPKPRGPRAGTCSAPTWPVSCANSASPRCAASPPCWPRWTRNSRSCGSCSSPGKPARPSSRTGGTAPGRRFLNVYGPTEATVSATWTLLEPGRPVTIGVPLPTYSVAIIDRQSDRVLPADQTGEIAIAGIGLAEGYLNLPDKTREAFTPDFAGMPGNPSRRIYRTGDLGKINADGQIVHKGRIDTQVKIRGYRIELAEIESVLRARRGVPVQATTVRHASVLMSVNAVLAYA